MQRPPGHAQNTPARATNSRPTTRRQRDATVREVDQGAKATESRVTWKGGVGGSPMGLKKGGGGRAYRPGRAGGTRESNWGRGRRRGCSGSQPFRMGQGVGGIIKRPFLVGCKGGVGCDTSSGWLAAGVAAGVGSPGVRVQMDCFLQQKVRFVFDVWQLHSAVPGIDEHLSLSAFAASGRGHNNSRSTAPSLSHLVRVTASCSPPPFSGRLIAGCLAGRSTSRAAACAALAAAWAAATVT